MLVLSHGPKSENDTFITPEDIVVAKRTIGYTIKIFVKEGYEKEWFWK